MQALVCHAPMDLRVESFPTDPLGPQQVRVHVAHGGICGSDLHYFQHGGFGTVRLQQPMVLGGMAGAVNYGNVTGPSTSIVNQTGSQNASQNTQQMQGGWNNQQQALPTQTPAR